MEFVVKVSNCGRVEKKKKKIAQIVKNHSPLKLRKRSHFGTRYQVP